MNILQILPELNVGGVETGTVDLARYLAARGHKSIVVSSGGSLVADLEREGTRHYTLPVRQKNVFLILSAARKLRHIIHSERIDIVHARSRVPAWVAYFACRNTKATMVTTCHGHYSTHFFSRVMGWGKRVIAISEVIARHMAHHFQVPPEFIRVIPRSVDLSRFQVPRAARSPSDPMVVTIIGRLTPLKGHRYFLKAMAVLVRHVPHLQVRIVGDAPPSRKAYKEELLLLVKRLGLTAQVLFMGNRRDVPELLSSSDCLVLSTVTQEAFGRVILEAQAAGVPVVATKVGGVVEIIDDEKTGLLVMPKDTEGMAKAVRRVLKDPALRSTLAAESRKKIEERYTIEHMAGATLKVYDEALKARNILVIKLTALGDVMLITASLKALREQFPLAQIHCLTSPEGASILQRCPHLNSVILFDPKHKNPAAVWNMGRHLRRFRFDQVIDFQNNRLSHLLAFLTLSKERHGYDNGKWSFFLTHKVKPDADHLAPVPHQFRILNALGITWSPQTRLEFWVSGREQEYVQTLLDSEWMGNSKDLVGINVSASFRWQTKNWPPEHIVRLCDLLGHRNIRVFLTGQKKDKNLARSIVIKAKAKPADFTGKTNIVQLAALIARCRVYVTQDSAPLHVAAAMRVPVVALFGPTDPLRHMPPCDHSVVLYRKLACGPCYQGTCRLKTNACVKEISPDDVVQKIDELLQVNPVRSSL